ncbi:MAG: hypothetical protein JSU63_16320 [Phycisphaerales bacterium]|nr:MAG: hypothetical protein JSU63_16320 [Phycisphaerales bacterium]
MRVYRTKLFVFGAVFAAIATAAATARQYDLSWFTVDAGGVTQSTSRSFELSGTTGQPDATVPLTGRSFELSGGFWFTIPSGDCNADGIVDLHDCSDFEACMAGPFGEPPYTSCPCFDRDGDRDVDLADFATLQSLLVGP